MAAGSERRSGESEGGSARRQIPRNALIRRDLRIRKGSGSGRRSQARGSQAAQRVWIDEAAGTGANRDRWRRFRANGRKKRRARGGSSRQGPLIFHSTAAKRG